MTDRRQTDRQTDHAIEKCVGIGGIDCGARSDFTYKSEVNNYFVLRRPSMKRRLRRYRSEMNLESCRWICT